MGYPSEIQQSPQSLPFLPDSCKNYGDDHDKFMSISRTTQRCLERAAGYLELRLPEEAATEIEAIPLEDQNEIPVLAVRLEVFQQNQRWPEAAIAAGELVRLQPENPAWSIAWAYVTRRAESIEKARSILQEAKTRHPDDAVIHYNLGCYAAQLGDLDEARKYVRQSISMDESFRDLIPNDPDLAAIRDEFLS